MTDTRLTNRREKSQQIRNNILDVSRKLFIQQGYSATTIRQILTETGITTGTLYHFFRDKEDILVALASSHLDDASNLVKSLLPDDQDPVLFYAVEILLMLMAVEKNETIAELYLNIYRLWRVCDMICHNHGEKNRQLFEKFSKGKDDEWWYARSLAITGIIQNCIAERINNKILPVEVYLQIILNAAFGYFNIQASKIEPITLKALTIVRKKNISLYGVYI